ncbi:MAG: 5'-nucleotidase C-terminal domain-containing protein [Armatimonadetes bacterium]|nr:5'-nucleotidase C-terminal domain-containing protein [Armatimonadota bacterium]
MLRSLRTLLIGGLVLLALTFASAEKITVLHFNDFHGNVEIPEEGKLGGIARIAGAVEHIRQENLADNARAGEAMLLIAGDVLQGTPMSTLFHGEADFECLNLMDVTAMCLGNHEFDYGMPNLHHLIDIADFPLLAANIRRKLDDTRVFPGVVTRNFGDEQAVIIGLTTPETNVTTMPSNVANIKFEDPVEVARTLCRRIMGQGDHLIIALTHLGFDEDVKLAQAVPDLDVIVGGHSHTHLDAPKIVGNTIIVTAEAWGKYLGRLDLDVQDGRVLSHDWRLIPMDESVTPDPEVAAVVAEYEGRKGEALQRVVGTAAVFLDGEREHVRSRETNLGNLITDAMRLVSGAPIAIQNGGGIRASIDEGPITLEEILTVLPFGNEVATVELTGEQIRKVLANAAARERPDGGFLHVSGLKVVINGNKLESVTLDDGSPLEPGKTYLVATNAFLMEGGDGFVTFTEGRNPYYVGTKLDTSVVSYLAEHGTVAPEVEGRIIIK